jgi:serine-type D-Ala-D-Ala carboxypeptidase (penicillin-binding protein 5/6)
LKWSLVSALAALSGSASLSADEARQPWSAQAPIADPIPVLLLAEMGSGQILFARQPELRFVPASVTKVMTAYTAFELMAQGKLSMDQRFTIADPTFDEWHGKGTNMNLQRSESVPVFALISGITTVSANDAAVVLAEGAAGSVAGWSALMNENARQLGMTHSQFFTPNGWMDNGATFVSARDLVTLGTAIITRHPKEYRSYFGKREMSWNGISRRNHDPAIGVVQGADGIKTGFTREAGYNYLGSAIRDGRRLIVVIAGASSEAQRASAARGLIEWGFSNWHSRELFAAGSRVGEAEVQEGSARTVALMADRAITVALPNDKLPHKVSLRIVYRGPLPAPLKAGESIAQLEITVDEMAPSRVPLLAVNDVNRAGPLDRLWNGLMELFT